MPTRFSKGKAKAAAVKTLEDRDAIALERREPRRPRNRAERRAMAKYNKGDQQ